MSGTPRKKRSQAPREAYAKLMGLPFEPEDTKPKKRVVTIWERCKVCADQMYGGPRCLDHNPTVEMKEASHAHERVRDAERVTQAVR